MTTPPRRAHRSDRARRRTPIEPLERRVLLSTINWSNRGTTDNFAIYGNNANLARTIVDRAIDDWERVIVNFNYAGGGNTYNLQVFAGAITGRGVTQNVTNNQGKPNGARITMDDNGAGGGWYFDPALGTSAVPDDSEYNGWINAFAGDSLTGGNDFYRTIVHEMGHAMGISVDSTLRISNFLADSQVDDPNDNGTATIRWIDFGAGEVGTMTEAGGGHLYEGPALPAQAVNVVHPDDLMNDGRTVATNINRRQLINDTHAMILREAYGYTVSMPSQHNTFHVNLNTQTNAVNIRGTSGNVNDTIHVDQAGGTMQFFFNGNREQFPVGEASSIVVSTSSGTNLVNFFNLPANIPATVVGGDGPDTVVIGSGDVDTEVLSPLQLAGIGGSDVLLVNDALESNPSSDHYNFNPRAGDPVGGTIKKDSSAVTWTYSGFERMEVFGAAQGGTINVNFIPPGMDAVINAGNNANSIRVAAGDYDANILGNLTINGQGGNDSITINDTLDTGNDTYNLTANQFSKSSGGGTMTFNTVEFVVLNASDGSSTIHVTGTTAGRHVYLNAGGGTDAINVTSNEPNGTVTIEPSTGDDPVSVAGNAAVNVSATQRIGPLTVSGGTVRVQGATVGSIVLTTTGLNVTGAGRINLFDEQMIVDYTGASPVEHVRQRVASGYNGGAWNGAGIMSSNAADISRRAVGFAESADLFTSFPATFGGQSVDNTSVVLGYTYYGDANLDGQVNLGDFNRLAANFGQGGRRWAHGDMNFDGTINLFDFNQLATNFGSAGMSPEMRRTLEEQLTGGTERDKLV
jgi:hypothetical protein